jgi:hypothetical protein
MTFKTILIYVIYFGAAIFGLWLAHYFKQFIDADFERNRKLNRNRKFAIAYARCFWIISISIFAALSEHDMDDYFLGFSGFFLAVYFAFVIVGNLEMPKLYHKPKKRKLKYKKPRL